jgi:hypothetical protein
VYACKVHADEPPRLDGHFAVGDVHRMVDRRPYTPHYGPAGSRVLNQYRREHSLMRERVIAVLGAFPATMKPVTPLIGC